MATRKEIKDHLELALKEVGKIKPWFDKEVNAWVFEHPLYPVEYAGDTKEEVIKNYPKYMKEFIRHRLNDNLAPSTEKKTKGHGGKREGAGRPVGTKKEPTIRVTLPKDFGLWLMNDPSAISMATKLMKKKHFEVDAKK
jgi:hypothetical protein